MKYVSFTDEEKVEMFEEISDCFYNANFGKTSKSDIELMMFGFYIKKMIAENQNEDGTVDYNKCSDYKISKELGITQQRVRNLKIKNQLINPIDFEWEKSFAHLIKNARYSDKKVILSIPDPNLYLEIQNFIEENGAYVEKQLNSKILQIRVEYFIDLIVSVEPEESRKNIIDKLKKHFKESQQENRLFDEKNIGKTLADVTSNIATIAGLVSECISPTNIIGKALIDLISK